MSFCFAISINEWINISNSKKYLVPGLFALMLSFYSAYKIRFTNYDEIDGALLFLFILFALVKAIVPRYRYDQLMKLGWKMFLPFSLIYVVLTSSFLIYFDLLPKV